MKDLRELIGQKIVKIRPITQKEREQEGGWDNFDSATSVIELENGVLIYPSSDDEGNCAGTLFGKDSKGNTFYVFSKETTE